MFWYDSMYNNVDLSCTKNQIHARIKGIGLFESSILEVLSRLDSEHQQDREEHQEFPGLLTRMFSVAEVFDGLCIWILKFFFAIWLWYL